MNRKCKLVATSSNSLCVYFLYSQSLTAIRKIVSATANSNLHHLSLPDLPPIFETPGPRTQRRGSMDYSGSPTVTRNAVVEEVGIEEAPGCAEENMSHQNVDVSMSEEAMEQAKCLILYSSIHSFSYFRSFQKKDTEEAFLTRAPSTLGYNKIVYMFVSL